MAPGAICSVCAEGRTGRFRLGRLLGEGPGSRRERCLRFFTGSAPAGRLFLRRISDEGVGSGISSVSSLITIFS